MTSKYICTALVINTSPPPRFLQPVLPVRPFFIPDPMLAFSQASNGATTAPPPPARVPLLPRGWLDAHVHVHAAQQPQPPREVTVSAATAAAAGAVVLVTVWVLLGAAVCATTLPL